MSNNAFIFNVKSNDFAGAGQVSSNIKQILRKIGVEKSILRRISVACYEAEINMIIHSDGGKITLEINEDNIRIICHDNGPGINDIDLAMEVGYSTASKVARDMGFGAGMGLANMHKCSDKFIIQSNEGEFTHIEMIFNT